MFIELEIKRLSRIIGEKCKKIYILGKDIQSETENCLDCQGKIVIRPDDSREGVIKRLSIFQKETMPVIEYFRGKNKLVEIDGDQSIEKVFADILSNTKNID